LLRPFSVEPELQPSSTPQTVRAASILLSMPALPALILLYNFRTECSFTVLGCPKHAWPHATLDEWICLPSSAGEAMFAMEGLASLLEPGVTCMPLLDCDAYTIGTTVALTCDTLGRVTSMYGPLVSSLKDALMSCSGACNHAAAHKTIITIWVHNLHVFWPSSESACGASSSHTSLNMHTRFLCAHSTANYTINNILLISTIYSCLWWVDSKG
jgi:hypothetical protein